MQLKIASDKVNDAATPTSPPKKMRMFKNQEPMFDVIPTECLMKIFPVHPKEWENFAMAAPKPTAAFDPSK